jgi:hypothetical protein
MEKLARNKQLFIGLSCVSIGSLVGAFGYPLQKLEIYRQAELGAFGQPYEKTYIVTESDQNYPYGFRKDLATKVAQIYNDYAFQKVALLGLAITASIAALNIGAETVTNAEIDNEVETIKARGKKELILEGIKHKLAMASKSQRLLFLDEMKALMEEFGSAEEETQEADELNALYEEASNQIDKPENSDFRAHFPESMDATSWKAVSKAIAAGADESEIVRDILDCRADQQSIGEQYVKFLKQKYE